MHINVHSWASLLKKGQGLFLGVWKHQWETHSSFFSSSLFKERRELMTLVKQSKCRIFLRLPKILVILLTLFFNSFFFSNYSFLQNFQKHQI